MEDLQEINNKKLALIMWGKDNKNKDDVAVFTGIARWNGNLFFIHRGKGHKKIKIIKEWMNRIQKITDKKIKKILLGADYCLSLRVKNLPHNDNNGYIKIGLKWPQ